MVTDGPKIFAGPLDGPFDLVPALDVPAPAHRDWPRLAPDGELFTREWNTSTTTSEIHAYNDSYKLDFVVTGRSPARPRAT